MQEVLILSGLPASGKSTYAKELMEKNPGKYKRINKDLLREMFDFGKWSKERENFIDPILGELSLSEEYRVARLECKGLDEYTRRKLKIDDKYNKQVEIVNARFNEHLNISKHVIYVMEKMLVDYYKKNVEEYIKNNTK